MQKLGGLKTTMKSGVTKRLEDNISSANFDLSKKSYRLQRALRQFLHTVGYVLLLVLLYYAIVRFVLSTSAPGKLEQRSHKTIAPAKVPKLVTPSDHKK